MSDQTSHNIVEQFRPNDRDEKVLELLKDAHETGDGIARTGELRREADIPEASINWNLDRLLTAGWIERVQIGKYRFVADPR